MVCTFGTNKYSDEDYRICTVKPWNSSVLVRKRTVAKVYRQLSSCHEHDSASPVTLAHVTRTDESTEQQEHAQLSGFSSRFYRTPCENAFRTCVYGTRVVIRILYAPNMLTKQPNKR